jgi:hypothetical protein
LEDGDADRLRDEVAVVENGLDGIADVFPDVSNGLFRVAWGLSLASCKNGLGRGLANGFPGGGIAVLKGLGGAVVAPVPQPPRGPALSIAHEIKIGHGRIRGSARDFNRVSPKKKWIKRRKSADR